MMTLQVAAIFFYGGIAFFAMAFTLRLRADFSPLSPKEKLTANTLVGLCAILAVASWGIIFLEILNRGYAAAQDFFG